MGITKAEREARLALRADQQHLADLGWYWAGSLPVRFAKALDRASSTIATRCPKLLAEILAEMGVEYAAKNYRHFLHNRGMVSPDLAKKLLERVENSYVLKINGAR